MRNIKYEIYNRTLNVIPKVKEYSNYAIFEYPCESNTICEPYRIFFSPGIYRIELWGASGGDARVYYKYKTTPEMSPDSGGHGAYVRGDIKFDTIQSFYLYLGGRGSDQNTTNDYENPVKGGWNFGGSGGLDKFDKAAREPAENGAGGGGAVDLRIHYADINNQTIDQNILTKSIESRIIVAGSGGGGNSGTKQEFKNGRPAGALEAISNGAHEFGGTQTLGKLGIGMDGIITTNDEGSPGGNESGYRGGFHTFASAKRGTELFSYGGTGGSSYISGHKGCISPSFFRDSVSNETNMIHESGFFFVDTIMIDGDSPMPDPYDNIDIHGHIGNGICRITLLYEVYCRTCYIPFQLNFPVFFLFLFNCDS